MEKWAKFFRQDVPTLTFSAKHGDIGNLLKELLDLIKSMSNYAANKKNLLAFAGYPNTGKSTILKLISEYSTTNLAKSSSLSAFKEVN